MNQNSNRIFRIQDSAGEIKSKKRSYGVRFLSLEARACTVEPSPRGAKDSKSIRIRRITPLSSDASHESSQQSAGKTSAKEHSPKVTLDYAACAARASTASGSVHSNEQGWEEISRSVSRSAVTRPAQIRPQRPSTFLKMV